MKSAVALTFHGLCPESNYSGINHDLAAQWYAVSVKVFAEAVEKIHPETCCTFSEFASKSEGDWIILTFDDGLISDYEIAYPMLKAKGLRGTFFVTTENIGQSRYISSA